jgi:hypothetical protein
MAAATTKEQKRAELARHFAVMSALRLEKFTCKVRGGGRGR